RSGICPRSVNFSALPSRFTRMRSRRCRSVTSVAGTSSVTSTRNASPFCWMLVDKSRSTPSIRSPETISPSSTTCRPASSFAPSLAEQVVGEVPDVPAGAVDRLLAVHLPHAHVLALVVGGEAREQLPAVQRRPAVVGQVGDALRLVGRDAGEHQRLGHQVLEG